MDRRGGVKKDLELSGFPFRHNRHPKGKSGGWDDRKSPQTTAAADQLHRRRPPALKRGMGIFVFG